MTRDGADIVVVGGGAAGCALAGRIAAARTASIRLLEAGPRLRGRTPAALRDGWGLPSGSHWKHDWGLLAERDGDNPAPIRRGRLLGGTSWLTRFAVRGGAADFDAWSARGCSGWSFADVLPAFRRLEADAEYGDRPWHGADGPIPITRYPGLPRSPIHRAALEALDDLRVASVDDHNSPTAAGAGPMPMSGRDGYRVTTLDGYLAGRARNGMRIQTDAEVASVIVQGGRAVGVRLIDGREIAAGIVVLAAGTYGSPTILLRSGIGPGSDLRALGIEVLVDLPGVGRNLADHPAVDLDSGWHGAAPAGGPILHSLVTFRSQFQGPSEVPDLALWLTDPAGAEPGFYLDPILMKSTSRGYVRLRSADPTMAPQIRLPSLTGPTDIDRLADGLRLGVEVANHPAVRKVSSGQPPHLPTHEHLPEHIRRGSYSLPHVVGTCRMGPNAADGDVVGPKARVHGIEALFVADASVLPGSTAGFPHVVTIMIAERIAGLLNTGSLT